MQLEVVADETGSCRKQLNRCRFLERFDLPDGSSGDIQAAAAGRQDVDVGRRVNDVPHHLGDLVDVSFAVVDDQQCPEGPELGEELVQRSDVFPGAHSRSARLVLPMPPRPRRVTNRSCAIR